MPIPRLSRMENPSLHKADSTVPNERVKKHSTGTGAGENEP